MEKISEININESIKTDNKKFGFEKRSRSNENEIEENHENDLNEKDNKQSDGDCCKYKTTNIKNEIKKEKNSEREKFTTQEFKNNNNIKNNNKNCLTEDKLFYMNEHFLPEDYRKKTSEVARDIVTYICHLGVYQIEEPKSNSSKMLRYLVDDLLKTRKKFMLTMAQNIEHVCLNKAEDFEKIINDLADEMFADGIITWNNIVTFLAFSSYLARYYKLRYMWSHLEEIVSTAITNVLIYKLGLWIVTSGGWDSFEKQFPTFCMLEFSSLWKILLVLVVIGTSVVMFYKFIHQLDRPNGPTR